MNKKAIIFTVAILILLVGASVIYFTMDRSSEAETENSSSMSAAEPESSNSPLETSSEAPTESEPKESASETTSSEVNSPEADALIRTFAEIGEPYTLHSRYYNQGEAKTEDAPWLGWDGDLELCISLKNMRKVILNITRIVLSGQDTHPTLKTRAYCM